MLSADLRAGEEPTGKHPWEPGYGWSQTDPVALASALAAVRRQICAYGPFAATCDCKYGLGQSLTVTPPPVRATAIGSEMTGCPELRSAIRMLLHPDEQPSKAPAPTPPTAPSRSEWLQTVAGEVREVQGRDLSLDGRD